MNNIIRKIVQIGLNEYFYCDYLIIVILNICEFPEELHILFNIFPSIYIIYYIIYVFLFSRTSSRMPSHPLESLRSVKTVSVTPSMALYRAVAVRSRVVPVIYSTSTIIANIQIVCIAMSIFVEAIIRFQIQKQK